MARRFIISDLFNVGDEIWISGEEAKHIMVLRHNVGDEIIVNDKICEIKSITKRDVLCVAKRVAEEFGVPDVKITLFQALLKSDKMEFVIQKSVEIGVSEVVPFISKNVSVKIDDKDKQKKTERWNKISVEASKQCGRSDIVKVSDIRDFSGVVEEIEKFDKVLLAYEKETVSLKDIIRENTGAKKLAVIIGSEGGFEKSEVEKITKSKNAVSISLGKRILRAETAGINLLSILMYEFEM